MNNVFVQFISLYHLLEFQILLELGWFIISYMLDSHHLYVLHLFMFPVKTLFTFNNRTYLFIYLKILSLQLPRNPYCSNEGTHCGCRLPTVTLQPPWVRFGVWGEVGSLYQSGGTLVKWDKQALPACVCAGVSCPLTLH